MQRKNAKPVIYLASQSARRRDILKDLKIPFIVVQSRYHERMLRGKTPRQLVLLHAVGKAKGARLPRKARWVLGADTVVVCGRKILGKPKSIKEAKEMLKLLQGRRHFVMTGIALCDRLSHHWKKKVERSSVHMRKMDEKMILNYFKHVYPLDKAGGYAIQKQPKIVTQMKGSYTNVVGFPAEVIRKWYDQMRVSAIQSGVTHGQE